MASCRFDAISNSEISALIDEWIHSERDRKILKARLIDGKTFAVLAEDFELSERHVKSVVYKAEKTLFKRIG